jgi:hypothetical protein
MCAFSAGTQAPDRTAAAPETTPYLPPMSAAAAIRSIRVAGGSVRNTSRVIACQRPVLRRDRIMVSGMPSARACSRVSRRGNAMPLNSW